MNFLVRRRRWGARYFNRQRMVRYIGLDVLRDGKVVSQCIDELINCRWVNMLKKGGAVSLNSTYVNEITGYIDRYLSWEKMACL